MHACMHMQALLWSPSSIGRAAYTAVQSAVASRVPAPAVESLHAASGSQTSSREGGREWEARSMERGPAPGGSAWSACGLRPGPGLRARACSLRLRCMGRRGALARPAQRAAAPVRTLRRVCARPQLLCHSHRLAFNHARLGLHCAIVAVWAAGPAAGGPCMCMDPCRFHPPYPIDPACEKVARLAKYLYPYRMHAPSRSRIFLAPCHSW